MLATLTARRFAQQDPGSRRYLLGSRLVRLGASASHLLGMWLRPTLERLVELSGETANLAVLEDGYTVYVAQVPSRHKVRMFAEVGNRLLPHTTAVGKVLLAFRPRAVAAAIIERNGLPARTPSTITDDGSFLVELDRVAGQGWALDDQEEEVGVACLAVPVFGAGASPVALSVSGPASRLDPARRRQVLPEMLRLAAEPAGPCATMRGRRLGRPPCQGPAIRPRVSAQRYRQSVASRQEGCHGRGHSTPGRRVRR
ncbi:MAG: IclR family transcriptional regulator [Actinomycetota bacterium]|nr:IclR family transcriptional regulator [Actinomycetota bacterium]